MFLEMVHSRILKRSLTGPTTEAGTPSLVSVLIGAFMKPFNHIVASELSVV